MWKGPYRIECIIYSTIISTDVEDRVMLPSPQSTILHCTQCWAPSVIIRQQASVNIDICYTDRALSVVSMYVHGEGLHEVQTQRVRFVVDILYKQIRNKSTTNRSDGDWALVHTITSVYRRRGKQQSSSHRHPSTELLTLLKDGRPAMAIFF